MKYVLLFFSSLWFLAGVCLTVWTCAELVLNPGGIVLLCPVPFILVIILGMLTFSIFTAKLVRPTLRLYQHEIFWQREERELNEAGYRKNLAAGQAVYNIFVTACFASCWLFVPLLFYGMSWVFINKYVCELRPNSKDFLRK